MNNDYEIDLSNEEAERHASQQREMYLQNEAAINKEKFELGLKEGEHKRNIEIARNLLNMNLSINQIKEATGLSLEEIKRLKNE